MVILENLWYRIGYALICVLCLLLGTFYVSKENKKRKEKEDKITIRFYENSFDWAFPSLLFFVLIILAMVVEYVFNIFVCRNKSDNEILYIFQKLIEGGICIPVLGAVLVWAFGKSVEKFKLYLSAMYTKRTPKIFFSVLDTCACIAVYSLITTSFREYDNVLDSILGRLGLWFIQIIGIWLTIDNVNIGETDEERRNVDRSNKRLKRPIDKMARKQQVKIQGILLAKYYGPMVGSLVLFAFAAVLGCITSKTFTILFELAFGLLYCFFIPFLIYAIYLMVKTSPSIKRSDKNLSKAINRVCSGEAIMQVYGRLAYEISRDDTDETKVCLSIKSIKVDCELNQEKANELFESVEKEYPDNEDLYAKIKRDLFNINKKRNDFLDKEYEKCKNMRIEELKKNGISA